MARELVGSVPAGLDRTPEQIAAEMIKILQVYRAIQPDSRISRPAEKSDSAVPPSLARTVFGGQRRIRFARASPPSARSVTAGRRDFATVRLGSSPDAHAPHKEDREPPRNPGHLCLARVDDG